MNRLLTRISVLMLLLLPGFALSQERRVALVVGANAYRSIPALSSAVPDARAVASRLRDLGFEVVGGGPLIDPTRAQLIATLDRFEAALQGAVLGLLFYAGHAVEVGGRNLLLPVDAPAATSERQLRGDTIDAQEILADMLRRAPRAVMILDACRDNPLPRDAVRGNRPAVGGARGLERIEALPRDGGGSFVVLAAEPGQIALDRLPGTDRDPNGLFTRHLLRALADPARPLPALMGEVRDAVAAAARAPNRRQVPEITDRMEGSGQVALAALRAKPPSTATPTSATTAAPNAVPSGALDLEFWRSVQGSRNPANFEEYLRRFPTGTFAGLARNRVEELRVPAPMSVPTTPVTPGPSESSPALEAAHAAYGGRDFVQAWHLLEPLARARQPEALYLLGAMLRWGQGRPSDPAAAVPYLRAAAEGGVADAMTTLAAMYRTGTGVAQDLAAAALWYRVQRQLRHRALQTRILPLEILQPTRLVHLQATILSAPAVERRL